MTMIEAKNKSIGAEDYNYKHSIRADVLLPATPCQHNKFIIPKMPDWFIYNADASCKICFTCSKEAATPAPQPPPAPKEPEVSLFWNNDCKVLI